MECCTGAEQQSVIKAFGPGARCVALPLARRQVPWCRVRRRVVDIGARVDRFEEPRGHEIFGVGGVLQARQAAARARGGKTFGDSGAVARPRLRRTCFDSVKPGGGVSRHAFMVHFEAAPGFGMPAILDVMQSFAEEVCAAHGFGFKGSGMGRYEITVSRSDIQPTAEDQALVTRWFEGRPEVRGMYLGPVVELED